MSAASSSGPSPRIEGVEDGALSSPDGRQMCCRQPVTIPTYVLMFPVLVGTVDPLPAPLRPAMSPEVPAATHAKDSMPVLKSALIWSLTAKVPEPSWHVKSLATCNCT